jgi:thiol-disulfide isomerase/thioredoxin
MENDAMMKGDSMMKSDDAMMMKKGTMKAMTREEQKMQRKEKAKMRAAARKMRWEEKAKIMKGQGMMDKDGTMMKKDEGSMMKKEGTMEKSDVMMKAGEYKDSTTSALSASVLSDGKTKVLFFHAGWCPACKAANTSLVSWYANGEGMLTVYKINYDTEKSLEQKYGVTYQHTFVKIDGQGKLIKLLQSPSDDDLKNLLKM